MFLDSSLQMRFKELSKRKYDETKATVEEFVDRVIDWLNSDTRHKIVPALKEQFPYSNKWSLPVILSPDWETKAHTTHNVSLAKKHWEKDVAMWLITKEELELLILVIRLHDIWEAARWDVVLDQKNMSSEEFERKCGEVIIKKLIKKAYQNTPEMAKIREAYDINFNKTHPLHRYFRVYEICSYVNAAIIAQKDPNAIDNPEWLVHNVLIRQMPEIADRIWDFPSLKDFVQEHQSEIESLFEFVEKGEFMKIEETRKWWSVQEKTNDLQKAYDSRKIILPLIK